MRFTFEVSERVTGIEPALSAWEADVLPLNYTRARRPAERADSACRPHSTDAISDPATATTSAGALAVPYR